MRDGDQAGTDPGRVAALRAGDERAFLALVQSCHPSMMRVARAFVRSGAIAEEVVQESWVAALEGLAAFEGRSPVRSWLLGVVANRANAP